jgi:uncharacterized protein
MLPERIGSAQLAEMAAQGASRVARVRASALPRLAGLLAKDGASDQLWLEAEFAQGPEGYPQVRLRISGTLGLVCQRCLKRIDWPLTIDVSLTIVAHEAETRDLADPFDSVLLDAEGGLELILAAEDEVLAALPLAPVHVEGAPCRAESVAAVAPQGELANRPFAGLDELMGRGGRGRRD